VIIVTEYYRTLACKGSEADSPDFDYATPK
jgi:hypothetical protein